MRGLLLDVEVRKVGVDVIRFQSKKTGRAETFTKLTAGCEDVEGSAVIVSMALPDGATRENTKLPFMRGDKVRFYVSELRTISGIPQARSAEFELLKSVPKGQAN